jgi:hypothetical protein
MRLFAEHMLGAPLQGERIPIRQYSLDHLLQPFDFPHDVEDNIESVKVTLLRLMNAASGALCPANGQRCGGPRSPRLQPGDRLYRVALPPPVPIRAVLAASPSAALSGRLPGVLGADLLTGPARRRQEIALRRPFLSGPPDLGVLVRNKKTQANGLFQCGGNLPGFEPRFPEVRTSRANTLVRTAREIDAAGWAAEPARALARPRRGGRVPFAPATGGGLVVRGVPSAGFAFTHRSPPPTQPASPPAPG